MVAVVMVRGKMVKVKVRVRVKVKVKERHRETQQSGSTFWPQAPTFSCFALPE
jgi:hypothetical protein